MNIEIENEYDVICSDFLSDPLVYSFETGLTTGPMADKFLDKVGGEIHAFVTNRYNKRKECNHIYKFTTIDVNINDSQCCANTKCIYCDDYVEYSEEVVCEDDLESLRNSFNYNGEEIETYYHVPFKKWLINEMRMK